MAFVLYCQKYADTHVHILCWTLFMVQAIDPLVSIKGNLNCLVTSEQQSEERSFCLCVDMVYSVLHGKTLLAHSPDLNPIQHLWD